jgi:hypothetical protein
MAPRPKLVVLAGRLQKERKQPRKCVLGSNSGEDSFYSSVTDQDRRSPLSICKHVRHLSNLPAVTLRTLLVLIILGDVYELRSSLMLVLWVVTPCTCMFLRNVGIYLQVHTALQTRRPTQTPSPPWEPQTSYEAPHYAIPRYFCLVPRRVKVAGHRTPVVGYFLSDNDLIPGSVNCTQYVSVIQCGLLKASIESSSSPWSALQMERWETGSVSQIFMSHALQL